MLFQRQNLLEFFFPTVMNDIRIQRIKNFPAAGIKKTLFILFVLFILFNHDLKL